jgi:hypothetical protein
MQLSGNLNESFIADYLSRNGAEVFAKELRSRPAFKRLLDESRLTMIIAPSDVALTDVASKFGQSTAEFLASSNSEAVLSNHLSVVPTQKSYPLFTAINGSKFGKGAQDLTELQPTANTIIGKVPIIVVDRAIFHEAQYPNLTLNRLSRDPLWLVVERTDPMGVLNSCQTTPGLAKLCRDPNAFKRLMALHYRNYPINKDARQQYTDITLKNGYAYYAIIPIEEEFEIALKDGSMGRDTEVSLAGRFENDNTDKYFNTDILRVVEERVLRQRGHDVAIEASGIKLYGNGLDEATQFWVPLRFYHAMTHIHESAFPTVGLIGVKKEDVARSLAESIDVYQLTGRAIGELAANGRDTEDYVAKRLDQTVIDEYLRNYGFPVPFTTETVYRQLMAVNHFREYPHSGNLDEYGWGLMQVTIPKTP